MKLDSDDELRALQNVTLGSQVETRHTAIVYPGNTIGGC
jgi:predicted thioesterase